MFSLRTLLLAIFVGCSSEQNAEIAPGKVEKTDVFSRFGSIESVELTTYDENGDELVYRANESNWHEVAALFENGIRVANDRKLSGEGLLRIRADGERHVGGLYYHGDTELIVGLGSEKYYWRGISAAKVREFMREHGTRTSPPN